MKGLGGHVLPHVARLLVKRREMTFNRRFDRRKVALESVHGAHQRGILPKLMILTDQLDRGKERFNLRFQRVQRITKIDKR